MTSAGSRVAHVPELLENILLQLCSDDVSGFKSAIVSQSVCRAFRDTIAGSCHLQRALLFAPPGPKSPSIFNPIMCQLIRQSRALKFLFTPTVISPEDEHLKLSVRIYVSPRISYSQPAVQSSWRRMYFHGEPYTVSAYREPQLCSLAMRRMKNSTLGEIADRACGIGEPAKEMDKPKPRPKRSRGRRTPRAALDGDCR